MTDQRGSRVKLHAMRDVQASTSRGLVGSKQRLLASQHNNLPMTADAQMLLKVLGKRPDMRTVEEIDNLFEWVLKNGSTNKLFSGIQDVICKTICREMTLYTAPPNSVICYQGDFGDVFYIIISGQVALYVDENEKKQAKPFEDDVKLLLQRALLDDNIASSAANNVSASTRHLHSDAAHQLKQFGKFIRFIGSGGTFGELAVMEPTAQRTCTVVSTTVTSFICLKRAAYQRLVRASNGDTVGFTQYEFLEDLFYFESWSHGDVQRFSNKLRQVTIAADSFLLRHGNEANVMYFIYSGIVQESMPMVCLMDEHGVAIKYTPVEEKNKKGAAKGPSANVGAPTSTLLADTTSVPDSAGHGIPLSELKRKRVSVEIALYEEHDICGEHALLYNQSHSKVDLRAITDVKALVMDRATWVDVFLVDRLETVVTALNLFKQVAQARDHWRETRVAIAVSHPRLLLTISTRAMMKHAHVLCGWCGSGDHNTGDPRCTKVIAAREKANIRKKRKGKTDKQKAEEFAQERRRVLRGNKPILHKPDKEEDAKASLKMRFRVAATAIVSSVQIHHATLTLPTPREQILKDWQVAANNQARICESHGQMAAPKLQVPDEVRKKAEAVTRPPTRLRSPPTKPRVARASYEPEDDGPEEVHGMAAIAPIPLAMQNSLAKDNVAAEFRLNLLQRLKTVQTVEAYQATRTDVLAAMSTPDGTSAKPTGKDSRRPRRPKVPKNRRHRRGPQSTRLYRRVDRMLKKLWPAEYSLPQVEDSLKDVKIRHD
ncbi:hypothetical protein H310_07546 [Aphanomyces invadans]|uniref:Cyclic nucleotide-binding domain-containing protein n=1 Tax=Aphanomyces invadans TaxID=157072 RepID=A0A024U3D4_9STRA|nr:hypothetical protein H310_07546 [Aphanomyces invadans]ETW00138.1 hypothetical protein H310_07546 [Aphanomyces invadans]|eukprot:XP_008871163.1 hypothetical protein H310_07546 [Aphanomyces invadans]